MARRMENALLRVGLTHLTYSCVAIDSKGEVARAFREADEIFVSRRILGSHRGPWPSKRTYREYVDVVNKESLRFLRRKIADAARARALASPARPRRAESAIRRRSIAARRAVAAQT
jgi:hypothetical protein